MKPKIVMVKDLELLEDQTKRLESLGDVTYYNEPLTSGNEWLKRCEGADVVCTGLFGFNTEKLYKLKDIFFSLPVVGVEFLDKEKMKERNIKVANSPGCNKEVVSEWILGMMFMNARNLFTLTRTTQGKEKVLERSRGLYSKNITILGNGHIGAHLGKMCECLGMKVSFFRRGDDLINSVKDADVIANCLSTNESTTGLLDQKFFFSLKKGSFFVSVARPKVYDISALKDALDKGILANAADDAASARIGDVEDSIYKKLLEHPKIFVTPHIAWSTDYEIRRSNDVMIDNVEAWIKGDPINIIK